MSKEMFEKASAVLWEKLKSDGPGVMEYAPFFDDYWNEEIKIVICNYENLGYEKIPCTRVTYDGFKDWVKYKKSKTVHFTAVFANALKEKLNKKEFTINDMHKSYGEPEKLCESMKNMMYMNLRPTSGANAGRANKRKTHEIIRKYKTEIKNFIESLDADVFIISSADSVGLFNFIFDLDTNKLIFKGKTKVNNMNVYSVKHFGWFFKYKDYHKKAERIVNDILQK